MQDAAVQLAKAQVAFSFWTCVRNLVSCSFYVVWKQLCFSPKRPKCRSSVALLLSQSCKVVLSSFRGQLELRPSQQNEQTTSGVVPLFFIRIKSPFKACSWTHLRRVTDEGLMLLFGKYLRFRWIYDVTQEARPANATSKCGIARNRKNSQQNGRCYRSECVLRKLHFLLRTRLLGALLLLTHRSEATLFELLLNDWL